MYRLYHMRRCCQVKVQIFVQIFGDYIGGMIGWFADSLGCAAGGHVDSLVLVGVSGDRKGIGLLKSALIRWVIWAVSGRL